MAISVKHKFNCTVPYDPESTLVRPSKECSVQDPPKSAHSPSAAIYKLASKRGAHAALFVQILAPRLIAALLRFHALLIRFRFA